MKDYSKTVIWKGIGDSNQTTEELHLDPESEYIKIKSTIKGNKNDRSIVIRYSINLTKNWMVKSVNILSLNEKKQELYLESDLDGNWFNGQNEKLDHVKGCIDIDISASPFTNSLPINRLGDDLVEKKYLSMLYIDLDNWQVKKVEQAYTKLGDGKYLYQGVSGNFKSEIQTDSDGLITEYPNLFIREKPTTTVSY